VVIDFAFPELPAWRRAKALLDSGAIGALRHVIVTWNVESAAVRLRLRNWKTSRTAGGGVLGNFVSHCFHYLEWFAGPLEGLSARLFGLPGSEGDEETTAAIALAFTSGAGGSLAMSCSSYAGSGHRIEFYGEQGALLLVNEGADYMRGFKVMHARRPAPFVSLSVPEEDDRKHSDGRIAPVARLAGRFLDAIEKGCGAAPTLADGYRVQQLIDAAYRSHDLGRWIEVGPRSRR
jgi:predicted dehydrogenase